jgi:uncharacterized protein YerC
VFFFVDASANIAYSICVMANQLPTEKKITAVAMLCEGNSIRSIERMTGVHRDTIMRLGVRMGEGCHAWSYEENSETQYVTVLEIPPVDSPSSAVTIAIAAKSRGQA